MDSQKHLFQLPADSVYLNAAYMSPLLKSVEEAGIVSMQQKRNPVTIGRDDFFTGTDALKTSFGKLIQGDAAQCVIIPSSSYGFATVFQNLKSNGRKKALTIADEFPSGYLTLAHWCNTHKVELTIVDPGPGAASRDWNERLLDAIDQDTSVLLMSAVHWMHGIQYDVEAISARCRETGCRLIVDGTQSVGALPFDLGKTPVDALVCAGYKWLLGPYGIGMMWLDPSFNDGLPLEFNWINRSNSRDFARLTNYSLDYTPGAGRYNMGETSSFIHVAMLQAALEQIHTWTPVAIQSHTLEIRNHLRLLLSETRPALLTDKGYSGHLFGLTLPIGTDAEQMAARLAKERISVSVRGNFIRVSPHVYNDQQDAEKLSAVLIRYL